MWSSPYTIARYCLASLLLIIFRYSNIVNEENSYYRNWIFFPFFLVKKKFHLRINRQKKETVVNKNWKFETSWSRWGCCCDHIKPRWRRDSLFFKSVGGIAQSTLNAPFSLPSLRTLTPNVSMCLSCVSWAGACHASDLPTPRISTKGFKQKCWKPLKLNHPNSPNNNCS